MGLEGGGADEAGDPDGHGLVRVGLQQHRHARTHVHLYNSFIITIIVITEAGLRRPPAAPSRSDACPPGGRAEKYNYYTCISYIAD